MLIQNGIIAFKDALEEPSKKMGKKARGGSVSVGEKADLNQNNLHVGLLFY